MLKYFSFILLTFWTLGLKAQADIKDSSLFITSIRVSYASQWPGGDLVNRFGWNSYVGLGVDIKTKRSLLIGIEGGFAFGNKIKEDVLALLRSDDGEIIAQDGSYAKVLLYERGMQFSANAGYIWSKWAPNPNSGILIQGGVGFLQHKVRIEHKYANVPALSDEYLKGYDRLTNGIMLKGFLGYQFLSNSRLWNFYAGVEYICGFTQSRRDWTIDLMMKEDMKRKDVLYGLKFGWIIPLYQRAPKAYYLN